MCHQEKKKCEIGFTEQMYFANTNTTCVSEYVGVYLIRLESKQGLNMEL